jgi:glucokinase
LLRAGVDIGGTKCLGVVVDDAGAVLREERLSTPAGADALLDVLDAVAVVLSPYDSFGVGAAGLVSIDGVWRAAPNVTGVWDFPVGARLAARLGHPVAVDNDATCAALAEWQAGAAFGASDVVLVTLGTGIGGGIVSGGRLMRGANGFAGEPGHMVVDPNGPPCVCGRRGCWERYASGSGLARLAREAATGGRLARVVALAGDAEAVRGEHVQFAAREGDHEALLVIDQWAWWVALGLVNLTNLLDPEVVVMGGGLSGAVDLVLAPVRRHFADLLYAPGHRRHPRIEMAALGEQAGAIGAALLVEAHA